MRYTLTTPAQRTYRSVLTGTPLTKGHALSLKLSGECLATLHHPPSSPHAVSYLSTLSSQRETHHTHKYRHRMPIISRHNTCAQHCQGTEGVVSPTAGATRATSSRSPLHPLNASSARTRAVSPASQSSKVSVYLVVNSVVVLEIVVEHASSSTYQTTEVRREGP